MTVRSPQPSDAELLAAWRQGRASAGQELFQRHYEVVERFLLNKVASTEVVDLVQETFVACIEGRDRIEDGQRFRSYLLGIAYRVFCKDLHRRYREGQVLDVDAVSLSDLQSRPSSLLAHMREQRLLLEGLRHICVKYQTVLELHYWEHLSTREIARVLGLPPGTVRGQLQRARDALEAAMASIERSRETLESTLTRLDDWAERCGSELAQMSRAS